MKNNQEKSKGVIEITFSSTNQYQIYRMSGKNHQRTLPIILEKKLA